MCLNKRVLSFCLMFFMLVNLVSLTAFASAREDFDESAAGSITVDYTYNSDPLDDVVFSVYKVGTYVSIDEMQTSEKFLDFDIKYTNLAIEEYWINLIGNLENYISLNQISADMEFITDDYGQYKLEDLSLGLYYIKAESLVEGAEIYFSEPIMIFVGQYDDSDELWVYDFTVKPKVSMLSYDPNPNITVTKVWENSNEEFVKTQTVEVELYCNGVLYDTAVLSDENNWQYTWYDMTCCDDWAILELSTLDDYMVDYSKEIYDYTITNTYIGQDTQEEPEPSEEPDEPQEEIPQTGSDAYQIPIFAGTGLILIMIGFIVKVTGRPYENKK